MVDRLYQIIEAHALGSWLTLEIITTGKELVWWKERMQYVNAAKESVSAVLYFGFLASSFWLKHTVLSRSSGILCLPLLTAEDNI